MSKHTPWEEWDKFRLITAAPELLDALKGLLAEYEFDEANPGRRKAFIAARLAVAKAEGV
jgi:hypothetical protein